MKACKDFAIVIAVLGSVCLQGPAQASDPSTSQSIGGEAVKAVLKHYSLNPLAIVPVTGKALAADGAWSINQTKPAVCPQITRSCVQVFYRVASPAVECLWVVSLDTDSSDWTFLEENDNTERYLIRRTTGEEAKPLVRSRSKPSYPPIAIAAHVTGTTVVNGVVDKTGKVQQAVVLSGAEMLRGASLDAAKKWTFTPMMVGQRVIAYQVQMAFTFKTSGPPFGNVDVTP